MNLHKAFGRRPGRFLDVFRTYKLCRVKGIVSKAVLSQTFFRGTQCSRTNLIDFIQTLHSIYPNEKTLI